MNYAQVDMVFAIKSAVHALKSYCFQKIMESICQFRNYFGDSLQGKNIRRILIVQMANIGDAVLSTPIISALANKYHHAEIHVLTGSENKDIFNNNPNIVRVIRYDSNKYIRHKNGSNKIAFLSKFIKNEAYDVVIIIRADFWFLSYLIFGHYSKIALYHIKHHPQRRMWLQYLGIIDIEKELIPHNVEIIFNSLKKIHIRLDDRLDHKSIFPISESYRIDAANVLRTEGIKSDFVVFHINTPFKYRNWPIDRFIALIDHVTTIWGLQCILVGGSKDEICNRIVLTNCKDSKMIRSVVGRIDLNVTAAIIEKAKVYVGNDSGPMHIAAAMGTPVLAFFGPQIPALFHPWLTKSRILYNNRACSPCWQRNCVTPEAYCMMDISIEQAMIAFDDLMKEVNV